MRKDREELLSITKAANILGVHRLTLRNWAERGYIPFLRTPGGHRRFRKHDVVNFLAEMKREQAEPVMVSVARQAVKYAIATLPNEKSAIVFPAMQTRMTEQQRETMRSVGKKLLGLTIKYTSGQADEQVLNKGREIGQTYGKFAHRHDMLMSEVVSTFNFFRNTIIEVVFDPSSNTAEVDLTNPRLYLRLNHFFNEVLLATVGAAESEI